VVLWGIWVCADLVARQADVAAVKANGAVGEVFEKRRLPADNERPRGKCALGLHHLRQRLGQLAAALRVRRRCPCGDEEDRDRGPASRGHGGTISTRW
jgi:hypothetical protein